MAIHVALTHRTSYEFDRPTTVHPHVVRLRPAPHARTPVLQYALEVEPTDHFVNWQQDPFGNHLARFVFPEPTRRLSFTVDLVVDMTVINPFDFFVEESAEHHPFAYPDRVLGDLAPYLRRDDPGPLLAGLLDDLRRDLADLAGDEFRTIDMLVHVNQRLQADIAYTTRLEPGVQSPELTLDRGLGSCRDTGWLLVQVLRHLGLAARFVSGYLVQLAGDDQDPLDGPAGPGEDFTDLHAWCEVYVPGAGWIGLDPTSGLFAGEGHVPLAATPEPASAAAIEGTTSVTEVTFDFANLVTRIHEDPRVTKPYDDHQRDQIDVVGRHLDERLADGDVRLTMGGEPTFISVDRPEEAEWTIAADGDHKRALGWDLVQRLAARFAPGGLVQHGQGKWYPGEPLPRWQTAVLWRTDGRALWDDPARLADPFTAGDTEPGVARDVLADVADRLGVGSDTLQPAHEDRLWQVWQDAQQPDGPPPVVDPDPARPLDGADVTRLHLDLDGDPGEPTGWVLPLFRTEAGDGWATMEWRLRRGRVVLTPGESPMGLRLPIASLGWEDPDQPPDRSTFAPRGGLDDPTTGDPTGTDDEATGATSDEEDDQRPRTALCAEVRNGRVHLFLPPLTHAEDFVALVTAIEQAATTAGTAVVLEGYGPPTDPRLATIVVAPDPGVLEVNVHPTATWDDQVAVTEGLYADARQCRLTTERFDLDGTHTGTGGGNHVTLGGATPADSPVLRRPDLLTSLLLYWQHHPALSYLFSSRFVGPTSQAPRLDEARNDRLHDLTIAMAELDRLADGDDPDDSDPHGHDRHGDHVGVAGADASGPPAWRVDRALRHLLTDLTGNTHRAEFCIDKLYSPDSERGRLGLLELRGFEMPPHPEMALVQALLVRGLVVRCWEDPYRGDPVDWATMLHDRFLLPWFVERDIAAVTADLRDHGIDVPAAWMDPFTEFRFPRLGSATVAGVDLELRGAIEPWDVLGEESTATGTARYVDSSVERVQVLARGLVPGRHVLTCNGRVVPLHPTAPGEGVAGVRFKAWAPWSSLHPSIGVQAPLTFDLVDTTTSRSLGGFRYHVVHPGGRAYDDAPVNAAAAEARRSARFSLRHHTPGPIDLAPLRAAGRRPDTPFPVTLDLRAPA